MDPEFWLQRWSDNLIGFHQQEVNPFLQQYWPELESGSPGQGQVFVPLCGKSLDMLWLSRQAPVLGVEISPQAVKDFFDDNGLQASTRIEGSFAVCDTPRLSLYCGDFFNLEPGQLAKVRAVYDRAALIALPVDMRAAYVDKLTLLLSPGVSMLLITLDYDQRQMDGPPFAVSDDEVHARFAPAWAVNRLDQIDVLAREAKFRERGLSYMYERIYLLNKQ